MLDNQDRGEPQSLDQGRPVQCDECTIQIGDGFQESLPFRFVDDSTPHPRELTVCWRCWESLNRRRLKRLAQAPHPQA
jgi:hypothetical protein